MVRMRSIFRYIPRRYRVYLFVMFIICLGIFFTYTNYSLPEVHVEVTVKAETTVIDTPVNEFDLFDDDDKPLACPSEIQFDIKNRQHLAIILASKLVPYVWKNFRALLCSGVDAYIMLDHAFLFNSSLRVDDPKTRTNRSIRSYSHRFLFVKNKYLAKFGVSYMNRLPSIQYATWDRSVVWLYHRINLTYAWILEHDVQWFDVRNMTYLFNHYANDTTDLLCDNIVPTKSFWNLWPHTQSDIFPDKYWIGTFSPLVRWSRRLLLHHYRYMQLIHKDRLQYEFNAEYRFQEFIMGTIVKMENLTIEVYRKTINFTYLTLFNISNQQILQFIRTGKHILHPVKYESILTTYRLEELALMKKTNSLTLTNMTLLKKEIIKQ